MHTKLREIDELVGIAYKTTAINKLMINIEKYIFTHYNSQCELLKKIPFMNS